MSGREDALRRHADLAVRAQELALHAKETGRIPYLADDRDCPDIMRLAALGEEFGEVCRAVHDGTPGLPMELAQLAGVALAWSVALERDADEVPRIRREPYDPKIDWPERFKEGPI